MHLVTWNRHVVPKELKMAPKEAIIFIETKVCDCSAFKEDGFFFVRNEAIKCEDENASSGKSD